MIAFTNNDALLTAITSDMNTVMASLSETIVLLIKNSVKEIVYDPYTELVEVYDRLEENGGFLGSWRADKNSGLNKITSFIYSDPTEMVFNPDNFQHGSLGEDRRPIMDEAIAEGVAYDFSPVEGKAAWWTTSRDYWTPVITKLNGGELNKFVRYAFGVNKINIV
jgi:hypothetical protein